MSSNFNCVSMSFFNEVLLFCNLHVVWELRLCDCVSHVAELNSLLLLIKNNASVVGKTSDISSTSSSPSPTRSHEITYRLWVFANYQFLAPIVPFVPRPRTVAPRPFIKCRKNDKFCAGLRCRPIVAGDPRSRGTFLCRSRHFYIGTVNINK